MHKEDINGYWIFENTPITRTGVFPYKGKQIDADGSMGLEPNRKYMVYRPRKEITNKQTLASFNGIFLTDEHEMLGKGQRDPGTKPIAGTVYNVHVSPDDPDVVLATLKVQSEHVKDLIQQGKRALSCGYYCDYKPEEGVYGGTPYSFVQVDLTGNHIALVKKGRMGEKCAVYDSADGLGNKVLGKVAMDCAADSAELTDRMLASKEFAHYGRKESQVRGKGRKFACDSAIDIQTKGTFMPIDNYDEMLAKALEGKGVKDKANIEKIIEFIGTLPAASAEPAKDGDDPAAAPVADPTAAPAVDPVAAPEADPVAEPAKDDDDPAAAPAADPTVAPTVAPAPTAAPAPTGVTQEEFQAAVDAAVTERYAKEDEGRQLAEDIAPKCGNLWKRGMDADDVAEAACEKLGHKDLPKEARIPFVKAIAAEAKNPTGDRKNACDGAFDAPRCKSSTMLKYLGK